MKTGIKWSIILLGSIISTGNGDSNEHFHLDHRNGRICLIEPAGSPFFSLGVNHIQNILQKTDRGDESRSVQRRMKIC